MEQQIEQNQQNNQQNAQQNNNQQINTADLAEALLNAVESRNRRNESSITKSFAEQYGMSEEDVKSVLNAEKQKRAEAIPASVQKRIDDAMSAANNKLISADIMSKATAMGCVDTDAAMLMLNREGITVDDNGTVSGVEDALNSLKESKSYLFNVAEPNAGQKQHNASGMSHGDNGADDVAAIRKALGLK